MQNENHHIDQIVSRAIRGSEQAVVLSGAIIVRRPETCVGRNGEEEEERLVPTEEEEAAAVADKRVGEDRRLVRSPGSSSW